MTKLIKDIQQRKLQANFTLNIDEKILNKIMENRTQLCVRDVCVCVSGPNNSISEIQEWFNIRKPVNITHYVNRLNEEIYMII